MCDQSDFYSDHYGILHISDDLGYLEQGQMQDFHRTGAQSVDLTPIQNEPFLSMHEAHKITATPMASLGFQTTIETFQMR